MEALVGGNKKRIIISAVVIVIILALTFTVLFYWLVENDDNIVNIPSQEQFPEINITNVDNIIVEYDSNITVNNISEAGIVFNEFISYNQEQNKHIFYGYYENNWTFVNATGHGYYQGVKYWKINANWYDRDQYAWRPFKLYDVSENGEVLRFITNHEEFPVVNLTVSFPGIIIDYTSNSSVLNQYDAESVFNEFINYSKEHNQYISDNEYGTYGNNWRVENATALGYYHEIKHWSIFCSWFDDNDSVWKYYNGYVVNENGEVVRLLGPI